MWLSLQKCAIYIDIYVHFLWRTLTNTLSLFSLSLSVSPGLSLSLITPLWNYISFLLVSEVTGTFNGKGSNCFPVSEVTGTFNGKQWSNCFPLRGDSPHTLTVWLGGFLVLILPYILRASISLFPQHLFLDFFGCISFVDKWPCSLPMGWIGWMRGEERVAYGYGPTVLVIMEST